MEGERATTHDAALRRESLASLEELTIRTNGSTSPWGKSSIRIESGNESGTEPLPTYRR
jgi:hypothetical protein